MALLKQNIKSNLYICFPFLMLLLTPLTGQATPQNTSFISHQVLYKMVQEHLKQKTDQKLFNVKIRTQKISKYIKLKTCTDPITLLDKDPIKVTGRVTLKLSCEQPRWKIYITSTISGDLPVVMTTHTLLKRATITPSDVVQTYVPYQKVRGNAITNLNSVIGNRTKRAIGPHKILTPRLIQPPYWVFKGQQVTIQTSIGSIMIKTKGTALKDGVNQEQVPIRNNSSKKIIKGIVIAPNTVWVP